MSETRSLSLQDLIEQLVDRYDPTKLNEHFWTGYQQAINDVLRVVPDALRAQEPPNHNQFRMDEIDAVMLSVDKWFDEGDEALKNNPATRAAAAREIALQAIERLQAKLGAQEPPQAQWQPIKTAPKDGTAVLLLSRRQVIYLDTGLLDLGVIVHEPKCAIGHWRAEGDSWVDENGRVDGDAHHLAVTGVWLPQQGGWFEPNEVTHWMPLPAPLVADTPVSAERST